MNLQKKKKRKCSVIEISSTERSSLYQTSRFISVISFDLFAILGNYFVPEFRNYRPRRRGLLKRYENGNGDV